jgi:hypothetical protein
MVGTKVIRVHHVPSIQLVSCLTKKINHKNTVDQAFIYDMISGGA